MQGGEFSQVSLCGGGSVQRSTTTNPFYKLATIFASNTQYHPHAGIEHDGERDAGSSAARQRSADPDRSDGQNPFLPADRSYACHPERQSTSTWNDGHQPGHQQTPLTAHATALPE